MDQQDNNPAVSLLAPPQRKELLESIQSPADLRKLPVEQLPSLVLALREFMIESVIKTGGHLSSSLGAADLARALEAYRENPQEQMGLIKQDRAYLFYEIGYSRASPYESAYRTVDRTLFGPTTEQVKADFERHGLSYERSGNEPADHFALECAYIQQIAQAGAEAAADGDQPAFEGARRELCRFLGAHLLVFAPTYLQNFTKRASTAFYRSLGQTASETLAWAERLTGAKPAEVLDIADFPLKTRRAGKEY